MRNEGVPAKGLSFRGERKKEGAARVSSDAKYTPGNCASLVCLRQIKLTAEFTPAGRVVRRSPECARCGYDRDEIKRRKALPLVKGPDGLRRKYLGIRKAGTSNQ